MNYKHYPCLKKYILLNMPYAFVYWFFCKLGEAYRITPGANFGTKLTGSVITINKVMASPVPSFHPRDVLVGIVGAIVIYVVVYFRGKNAKKFRKNVEYGSARWSA